MYVCVCNAVTEDDVRGCVESGACSTREAKIACDWKPGCGSCAKRLLEVIKKIPRGDTTVDGDVKYPSCHDQLPWKATTKSSRCSTSS